MGNSYCVDNYVPIIKGTNRMFIQWETVTVYVVLPSRSMCNYVVLPCIPIVPLYMQSIQVGSTTVAEIMYAKL